METKKQEDQITFSCEIDGIKEYALEVAENINFLFRYHKTKEEFQDLEIIAIESFFYEDDHSLLTEIRYISRSGQKWRVIRWTDEDGNVSYKFFNPSDRGFVEELYF